MQKKKAAKLAGFAGALCASGALIAFGVAGTGAYFSDSHDGTISASTGGIHIDTTDTSLNFANLLPGDYQTKTIDYTARPNGGTEDVWLVLPNTADNDAFTGTPQAGPTPLGRYGHFALASTGGAHFTSFNLANPGDGIHSGDSCNVDPATGWGGSDRQAATVDDDAVPFCAPAHAILLQSNMAAGDAGHVNLTFGFTPILKSGQDSAMGPIEQFQIVATQHGVRPDDPNN
jgi:hypothetical protein